MAPRVIASASASSLGALPSWSYSVRRWASCAALIPGCAARCNACRVSARRRAEHCAASTIRLWRHLAKSYRIDTLLLYLGGDFITGYLHEELAQTNSMAPVEEAQFAKELLIGGLDALAAEKSIKKLHLVCMRGNHGRTTRKMQFKNDYETSFESMIYWGLQERYEKQKRITVEVPRGDVHLLEVLPDWHVRMYHGHQVRYGDGVGGLTIPLNKWQHRQDTTRKARFNLMGHYHNYSLPNPNTLLNGSLKGYDEYAASHGFRFEEPYQALCLVDAGRKIVAQHMPIFCQ